MAEAFTQRLFLICRRWGPVDKLVWFLVILWVVEVIGLNARMIHRSSHSTVVVARIQGDVVMQYIAPPPVTNMFVA